MTQPSGETSRDAPAPTTSERWVWLGLALVLALTTWLRLRLVDVPLDRDEGEFAYIAQQWLDGVPPYASGYAMKSPGIYLAYAGLISCFGQTARGIHLGFGLLHLTLVTLLYLIARRWFSPWLAIAAAALFALLTLDPSVQGCTAQAESFVLLPALTGMWLLTCLDQPQSKLWQHTCLALFLTGLCFGAAVMIKQHGLALGIVAIWYVVDRWWRESARSWIQPTYRLAWLAAGMLTPVAAVLLIILLAGVFEPFWFWTVDYARQYASRVPADEGLWLLGETSFAMFMALPLAWALALAGLLAACYDDDRSRRTLLLAWLCCSFLATCPGFYFRPHYFVLLMPPVAVLAALGCDALVRIAGQGVPSPIGSGHRGAMLGVAALVMTVCVWGQRNYYFADSPTAVSRLVYLNNPFPEVATIADYLARHSRDTGPIMVVGSEPQLYFYLHRRAASPHIYMYPLLEEQPLALTMQKELAASVEARQPEWIVFESVPAAWLQGPKSELWIFNWIEQLLARDYQQVGLIEIGNEETTFRWDADLAGRKPSWDHWLGIYRRKSPDAHPSR